MAALRVSLVTLSDFAVRTASTAALAPMILFIVWIGEWVFFLLLLTSIVLLASEWNRLTGGSGAVFSNMMFVVLAGGSLALAWFFGYIEALVVVAAAVGVEALLAWRKKRNVPFAAFGPIYIIVPLLALMWLRGQPVVGIGSVVWLFLVVWSTDIFAYLIGGTLHSAKLAPSISPGKTWAGLIGGVTCAGLAGGIAGAYLLSIDAFVFETWSTGIQLGIFIGVTAQIGDLGESWLKRLRMLKDSGRIIPGHGGLLDRVDGLMTSAPMMAVLVWVVG